MPRLTSLGAACALAAAPDTDAETQTLPFSQYQQG